MRIGRHKRHFCSSEVNKRLHPQQVLCPKSKQPQRADFRWSRWLSSSTYEPPSSPLLKKHTACLSSVHLSGLNHRRGNIVGSGFTEKCLMLFIRLKGQFTQITKKHIFSLTATSMKPCRFAFVCPASISQLLDRLA